MRTFKLISVKRIESSSKKYDIQVLGNNNFVANNIVVHNSLIIVFYYEPRLTWIVASRGSFISEQCLEAQKMLKASDYEKLDIGSTYLFEIIY